MEQKNMSTTYVPLQYPYQIIKYKKDIAMQIGTLIVTTQKEANADGQDYHIETHSHPVVTYDNKANAKPNSQLAKYQFLEGVVWNNVEVKDVTTICLSDARLSWREFIDFLEEDLRCDESAEAPCIDAFWKISKLAGGVAPPEESDLVARFFIDVDMSSSNIFEKMEACLDAYFDETNGDEYQSDDGYNNDIDDCDLLAVGTSPLYSNEVNTDDFCFFAKYDQDHPDTWKSAIKEQIEQYRLIFQNLGSNLSHFHIFYRTDHYTDGLSNQQVDDYIDGLNACEDFTEFYVWPEEAFTCDKLPESSPLKKLLTPKAKRMWHRLQEAGMIDKKYQPVGLSRTEMAIVAYDVSDLLGIKNMWVTFGRLWNKKNLRNDYNDSMYQKKSLKFRDKLKKILADIQ